MMRGNGKAKVNAIAKICADASRDGLCVQAGTSLRAGLAYAIDPRNCQQLLGSG
jgi:hypothetical protein